uniref:Uncharacterized protein n=1 Tax=Cyclopterus lumpus TaxID=8103 RepID=A0A8C2XH67_CYCLU
MILSSQGGHHHGQELLESCLDFTSEVQHAQLGVGVLQVVHVLHTPLQTVEDSFSVFCNQWISHDCSGVVEVSKVTKIPLSPGVDDQTAEEKKNTCYRLDGEEMNICDYLNTLCTMTELNPETRNSLAAKYIYPSEAAQRSINNKNMQRGSDPR